MYSWADVREALTDAAIGAYNSGKGVWPYDHTESFTVSNLKSITDHYPVLPKLFRRLTEYLKKNRGSVRGFKEWLAGRPEAVLDLRYGNVTHFDEFVFESGKKVGLLRYPEELVFLS
ncbi:MAG: hypothetical protein IH987_01325 [Planctomycetes bacterium]|nr:hypothetical protein [Planctomycetota bacterium]